MHEEIDLNSLIHILMGDAVVLDESLDLDLGGYTMRIRSNQLPVIEQLAAYFAHVKPGSAEPDIEILAIEREVVDSKLDFIDWAREPGKTGRKDAYFDIPGARVVLKVRTGMLFLQSETALIAAGPCLQYDNQVINYINSQYMNWLQHNGWLICHASGLEINGHGVGMAGLSGGGKSTLMLNLLENNHVNYLTNDRLFIRRDNGGVLARGIPKLPRINPGTIVHNPRLHGLISSERREELLRFPAQELWVLEEKYDVHVEQVYGPQRVSTEADLKAFVILNWQRDSAQPTQVTSVDIGQRRELLAALMKSPGPFYQYTDGSFHSDTAEFDEQSYLDALHGVTIYEVTGRIDFAEAENQLGHLL
ncbi:MAG: HprK-related kinase B [Gammaproteobacteria bacterium]|nr:HprK-related kinase B [Gammaproteobacteria bacterium]